MAHAATDDNNNDDNGKTAKKTTKRNDDNYDDDRRTVLSNPRESTGNPGDSQSLFVKRTGWRYVGNNI